MSITLGLKLKSVKAVTILTLRTSMFSLSLSLPPLQYDDLEDSMTDALVNDKPQFVRLFTENGLNILEYLTYERLENLYQSLSSTALAYTLLQMRLRERHSLASQTCSPNLANENCKGLKSPMAGPSSARGISLLEVRGQRLHQLHTCCGSLFPTSFLCSRFHGY